MVGQAVTAQQEGNRAGMQGVGGTHVGPWLVGRQLQGSREVGSYWGRRMRQRAAAGARARLSEGQEGGRREEEGGTPPRWSFRKAAQGRAVGGRAHMKRQRDRNTGTSCCCHGTILQSP